MFYRNVLITLSGSKSVLLCEMEAIGFSEILIPAYQNTPCHIPEDHYLFFFLDENSFVCQSCYKASTVILNLSTNSTGVTVFCTVQVYLRLLGVLATSRKAPTIFISVLSPA